MRIRNEILLLFLFAMGATATSAQSAPPTVLYHLQPGSTYEDGCYGPCMCPNLQAPLEGAFGLEFLPSAAPFDRYAVDPVNFTVPALNKTITGSGIYDLLGELNEMSLTLRIDGAPAQQFWSGGFVPSGAEFPDIDIVVSVNQMQDCFDYVLHIVASPSPPPPWLDVSTDLLTWTPVDSVEAYDVVCGDLDVLRASGDFTVSTDLCLESEYPQTSLNYDLTPGSGEVLWFLVRGDGGSYDTGSGTQVGPRDAAIDASILSCP